MGKLLRFLTRQPPPKAVTVDKKGLGLTIRVNWQKLRAAMEKPREP